MQDTGRKFTSMARSHWESYATVFWHDNQPANEFQKHLLGNRATGQESTRLRPPGQHNSGALQTTEKAFFHGGLFCPFEIGEEDGKVWTERYKTNNGACRPRVMKLKRQRSSWPSGCKGYRLRLRHWVGGRGPEQPGF